MNQIIEHKSKRFVVGDLIGDYSYYRLYLCREEGSKKDLILQIAIDASSNGKISNSAYILRCLKRYSDRVEAIHRQKRRDPKMTLNYDYGFPFVVDTFSTDEDPARQINILSFKGVDDVRKLKPLSNIIQKDNVRIDLRSSVWIIGKGLKTEDFAHRLKFSIGSLNIDNILIEPEKHYVLIFDWSGAQIFSDEVPVETREQEIAETARSVIYVLGGDPDEETFIDDNDPKAPEYYEYLFELAGGNECDAGLAHDKFYELTDRLWPREFHELKTLPRN